MSVLPPETPARTLPSGVGTSGRAGEQRAAATSLARRAAPWAADALGAAALFGSLWAGLLIAWGLS